MSVTKPYKRTFRQFRNGEYFADGHWMYVLHPSFANETEQYVHAFMLIQRDLIEIFDFVEPSDNNKDCYSYRIHALLMRACIELEANCKAILNENGCTFKNLGMKHYEKIENSHLLSQYEVRLPSWKGKNLVVKPFKAWKSDEALPWYQVYNRVKHDRHHAFTKATLSTLVEAVSGLVAILAAQFGTYNFSSSRQVLALSGIGGPPNGFESAIGDLFQVRFPLHWDEAKRYDFIWQDLKDTSEPIEMFPYGLA